MALQDLTPQLRTRLSRMERAVGIFVILATLLLLAGFSYYVYHTAERKGWFLSKVHYFTFVDSAAGLKVGAPVMMMALRSAKSPASCRNRRMTCSTTSRGWRCRPSGRSCTDREIHFESAALTHSTNHDVLASFLTRTSGPMSATSPVFSWPAWLQ